MRSRSFSQWGGHTAAHRGARCSSARRRRRIKSARGRPAYPRPCETLTDIRPRQRWRFLRPSQFSRHSQGTEHSPGLFMMWAAGPQPSAARPFMPDIERLCTSRSLLVCTTTDPQLATRTRNECCHRRGLHEYEFERNTTTSSRHPYAQAWSVVLAPSCGASRRRRSRCRHAGDAASDVAAIHPQFRTAKRTEPTAAQPAGREPWFQPTPVSVSPPALQSRSGHRAPCLLSTHVRFSAVHPSSRGGCVPAVRSATSQMRAAVRVAHAWRCCMLRSCSCVQPAPPRKAAGTAVCMSPRMHAAGALAAPAGRTRLQPRKCSAAAAPARVESQPRSFETKSRRPVGDTHCSKL